ncbi:MAG: response regulator [Bacteroidota bacterium]
MPEKTTVPTVMLIDDNRIDIILNRKVLEKENIAENIQVFEQAETALDYLKQLEKDLDKNTNQVPSMIFIDVVMPQMNGFQFIKAFDALSPALKSKIKIILISSALLTTEQQASLSQYQVSIEMVGKPLTKSTLDKLR